jgi:hypothetical protein
VCNKGEVQCQVAFLNRNLYQEQSQIQTTLNKSLKSFKNRNFVVVFRFPNPPEILSYPQFKNHKRLGLENSKSTKFAKQTWFCLAIQNINFFGKF